MARNDLKRIRDRMVVWVVVGVAATAMVVLRDVGALLAAAGAGSERGYGPGVFVGPRFASEELRAAIEHWAVVHHGSDAVPAAAQVLPMLQVHLLVDGLLLVPALAYLIGRILRRAGARPRFVATAPWVYAVLDWAETGLTYVVLVSGALRVTATAPLFAIQLLSLLKWLALGGIVIVLFLLWRVPDRGVDSFGRAAAGLRQARGGGTQPPALVLAGLLVLTGAFALLVAVPAGGPLEQIPDVLRFQLSGAPLSVLFLSAASLLVFTASLATAGLLATSPASEAGSRAGLPTAWVLGGAGTAALAGLVTVRVVDGRWSLVPATALLVLVSLWGAARIRRLVGTPASIAEPDAMPAGVLRSDRAVLWLGGIAGAAVMMGGLGLVRAAAVPWLLSHIPLGMWGIATIVGGVTAIGGGAAVQHLVVMATDRVDAWARRTRVCAGALVFVVVWGVAAWLAADPSGARHIGTTGAVAVGFSSLALLFGLLAWLSRRWRRWAVTTELGLGVRTPWLTLLLAVWLAAGLLETTGGYHDVRVLPAGATPRYADLDVAFDAWVAAQDGCVPDGRPVPLLLIAAPGGGIRAAYWTATALEALAKDDPCAARRVFAVSGASGGSVGAATWVGAAERGLPARGAVTAMAEDRALASVAAALLTRDLLQPLTGVSRGQDRAARMEAAWLDATEAFGVDDEEARWSELGAGLPWAPVLALNSASVTDGCRIIVTNVGGLPAVKEDGCQSPPGSRPSPDGPASAAMDLEWVGRTPDGDTCTGAPSELRTTTAALLSARFPYVTPSGALRGCVAGDEHVAYAVDGGYYENSGLLTLLDIYSALAPTLAGARPPDHPEADFAVEPWILVIDNHHRTVATLEPPARPRELLAPLQAVLARGRTFSPAALEQRAAYLMRAPASAPDSPARFLVVAPRPSASVSAPLGWVLSDTTRADLDRQLSREFAREEVARLRSLLGAAPDPEPAEE